MKEEKFSDIWQTKAPKQLTEDFINHIYTHYHNEYDKESVRYEKKNNRIFLWVAVIGLLTTLFIGLQGFFPSIEIWLKVTTFILPLISSFLLIYATQKGYKRKEELRENARIQSKFLVDSARIKFAMAKTDADYLDIYQWLNEEVRKLQLNQATEYFTVHNNRNSYET